MNHFKKGSTKEQPDLQTLEIEYNGEQYCILPSLYKRVKDGDKFILKECAVDNIPSEQRTHLKRYLMAHYSINDRPPAKRIEDIIDDIKLCFEPIKELIKKYPNTITFHSNENGGKNVPYIISIDLSNLEQIIETLL